MAIPKLGLRFAGVLRLRLPPFSFEFLVFSFALLGGSLKAEGFGDGFSLAKHILCESRNRESGGPCFAEK